MSVSFDFTIIGSIADSRYALVMAQNEDAFNYLVDEHPCLVREDGYARIDRAMVGDFESDAAWERLTCQYL